MRSRRNPILAVTAVVAALALLVELTLGAVQRWLTPGPRRQRVLPGLDATAVAPPA
jgi:hypothetical protein